MEQKNLTSNNYLSLITYQIKEKRNWFIVSISIMLITLFAVPLALNSKINEQTLVLGMMEIATLLFISLLIDFSYLHDNRKLTYYFSKPTTRLRHFGVMLAANAIYGTVLLFSLVLIGLFAQINGSDFIRVFLLFTPWFYLLILIAGLSSLLTGNTIAAGVATLINATLPLSLLGVIYFGFDIVGNLTNGFNTRVLFNVFTEKFYRIDLLYFVRYAESGFSPHYFLVIFLWVVILGSLINYTIKKRKDEKSGDFVVFDGYKNMISVLFASLVPIGFHTIFGFNVNVFNKLISFIILSALTYYLIHAILDKSFRIAKPAMALYAVFVLFFGAFLLTTNVAASSIESSVPDPSEIRAVYFDYQNYVWTEERVKRVEVYRATEEMLNKSPDASLYKEQENIENIIGFHKEMIKSNNFYSNHNLVIMYFYHDGSTMYRSYDLQEDDAYDKGKDSYLTNLLASEEYRKVSVPYIFDQTFIENFNLQEVTGRIETSEYSLKDTQIDIDNFEPDLFRQKYKNDYQKLLETPEPAINMLFFNHHGEYVKTIREDYGEPVASESVISINLELYPGQTQDTQREGVSFRITEHFPETFTYLLDLEKNDENTPNSNSNSLRDKNENNNESLYNSNFDDYPSRIV